MGTFHDDKGDLHGITVVVETDDDHLYVGRCFEENDVEVVLLDVDVHEPNSDTSREDYLERAKRFGIWKKHASLRLPRPSVTSLRRLVES